MQKLFYFIAVVLFLFAGNVHLRAQKLVFMQKEYNFGDVYDGDILNYSFYLTNTHSTPVVVSQVTQSCGCVLSLYPRQPIQQGDTAVITLKFNTNGKKGKQTLRIEVTSNDKNSPHKLYLKANVRPRSERKSSKK